MNVELYPGDLPTELASPGTVHAGQEVIVRERRSQWLLVRTGSGEGWLPEWYLTADPADRLPEVTPYTLVAAQRAPVYLYPNGLAPVIRDLDAGKVVQVRQEYRDWRYVRIVVYDIPAIMRGWVPSRYLASAQQVPAREGKILAGTRVYMADPIAGSVNEITDSPREDVSHAMIVHVNHELGNMAYVSAAGGWSAWVAREHIVFDPFLP